MIFACVSCIVVMFIREMLVKKLFASLFLFAATLAMAGSASAVVISGSSYTYYLAGGLSGNAQAYINIFDNQSASVVRDGVRLKFSESDTALGNGNSLISLNLSADGDLFPTFNESGLFGIGTFGDVIDLASNVSLYDARVTVRDLAGNVLFASDNVADFSLSQSPWDGSFPTTGTLFSIDEIGGMGAANVTIDFYVNEAVSAVPEPGSVLLCGLGLLAIVAMRRQRQSKS